MYNGHNYYRMHVVQCNNSETILKGTYNLISKHYFDALQKLVNDI